MTKSWYCFLCLRRCTNFTVRLRCSCLDSCCSAPVSKVRFINGGAQQFLLKWAECMKGFSVDIFRLLPGDPFPPCLGKVPPLPLRGGRWRRLEGWGRWKLFDVRVWTAHNGSGSPTCAECTHMPLTAAKPHLYFQPFVSLGSPCLQNPKRKGNKPSSLLLGEKGGINTFHR